MRIVLGLVAALVLVGRALAAPAAEPGLSDWVAQNTDLAPSQIAIAGAENVYSVEPLGARAPTGEVVALVRTEAVTARWRVSHGFQSWDAHVLFDCNGRRMRVIRSASYPETRRQGTPTIEAQADGWISPQAGEPGMQLLSAACDASFVWPLRSTAGEAQPAARPLKASTATVALTSQPEVWPTAPERADRSPLLKVRRALDPLGRGLAATTKAVQAGVRPHRAADAPSSPPSTIAAQTAAPAAAQVAQDVVADAATNVAPPGEATKADESVPAPAASPPQFERGAPLAGGASRVLRGGRYVLARVTDGLTAGAEAPQAGWKRFRAALRGGAPSASTPDAASPSIERPASRAA